MQQKPMLPLLSHIAEWSNKAVPHSSITGGQHSAAVSRFRSQVKVWHPCRGFIEHLGCLQFPAAHHSLWRECVVLYSQSRRKVTGVG